MSSLDRPATRSYTGPHPDPAFMKSPDRPWMKSLVGPQGGDGGGGAADPRNPDNETPEETAMLRSQFAQHGGVIHPATGQFVTGKFKGKFPDQVKQEMLAGMRGGGGGLSTGGVQGATMGHTNQEWRDMFPNSKVGQPAAATPAPAAPAPARGTSTQPVAPAAATPFSTSRVGESTRIDYKDPVDGRNVRSLVGKYGAGYATDHRPGESEAPHVGPGHYVGTGDDASRNLAPSVLDRAVTPPRPIAGQVAAGVGSPAPVSEGSSQRPLSDFLPPESDAERNLRTEHALPPAGAPPVAKPAVASNGAAIPISTGVPASAPGLLGAGVKPTMNVADTRLAPAAPARAAAPTSSASTPLSQFLPPESEAERSLRTEHALPESEPRSLVGDDGDEDDSKRKRKLAAQ